MNDTWLVYEQRSRLIKENIGLSYNCVGPDHLVTVCIQVSVTEVRQLRSGGRVRPVPHHRRRVLLRPATSK